MRTVLLVQRSAALDGSAHSGPASQWVLQDQVRSGDRVHLRALVGQALSEVESDLYGFVRIEKILRSSHVG